MTTKKIAKSCLRHPECWYWQCPSQVILAYLQTDAAFNFCSFSQLHKKVPLLGHFEIKIFCKIFPQEAKANTTSPHSTSFSQSAKEGRYGGRGVPKSVKLILIKRVNTPTGKFSQHIFQTESYFSSSTTLVMKVIAGIISEVIVGIFAGIIAEMIFGNIARNHYWSYWSYY